jgi:hypothetical protein
MHNNFIQNCNILTILYNHFIVYTRHFIEKICDLNSDWVLKIRPEDGADALKHVG